ncbi:MAG: hypothetical protein KGI37_10355 [Alphaproteobacteria bacterium]|nr:hypothetical protein [Alphaproteobacteria bacterium]
MSDWRAQKPGIEEWLYWAEVVVDRLSDCVHTYKRPPYADVFIPEGQRQIRIEDTVKLLHRVHALSDQAETPTDSIADVHRYDERLIDGMAVTFSETLRALPHLSTDMQKLMKSPWQSHFPNKIAQTLFLGDGDEAHGIGSGHIEHGRLPEALFNLIEREKMGDMRRPREELLRQGEPRRNDAAGRARWAQKNGGFLRSAGRVE